MMPPFTLEIGVVLAVTAAAIFLFVTEWLAVDVVALLVLVTLGLLSRVPALADLITTQQLFAGFSSNAVISIIAVMTIGAGLDKAGLMTRVAALILRAGTNREPRIMALVSGSVAMISSFMQNVAAAALFLPVLQRISTRTGIPMSRLVMPMGFSTILGGTVTMVGSGPLILLNDLLPSGMKPFGLFEVTPLGLSLVVMGLLYFAVLGHRLLPRASGEEPRQHLRDYFRKIYAVDGETSLVHVAPDATIDGWSVGKVEETFGIDLIGLHGAAIVVSPHRDLIVGSGMTLAVMAGTDKIAAFVATAGVTPQTSEDYQLVEALSPDNAGIAEVVIRPDSALAGRTIREIRIRKTFGITPLAIVRGRSVMKERLRDVELGVGDTILCFVRWSDLATLEHNPAFAILTAEYPRLNHAPGRLPIALAIFAVTFGAILFTGIHLALALLTGAIAMVVTGVLTMDEAYEAISWKTVFLLAGLIPLGTAAESTGTAAWAAHGALALMGDQVTPLTLYFTAIALATVFSLVMSNLGATVILVPLVLQMAVGVGADPRLAALLVGVGVSNTFLLPTHQVNALIMGPGGYRVADFIRAGGIMTVLFMVISVAVVAMVYT